MLYRNESLASRQARRDIRRRFSQRARPRVDQVFDLERLRRMGGKSKLGKVPVWLWPRGVDVDYTRRLLGVVRAINSAAREAIFPFLRDIAAEAAAEVRSDDSGDSVATILDNFRIRASDAVPFDSAAVSSAVASSISSFNDNQWRKTMKAVIGIQPFTDETFLPAKEKGFVAENVRLIKSLEDDAKSKIEGIVERGILQGVRHETIKKQLVKQFGVNENRAKLIARDQVAKYNGALMKDRQQSLGLREYIWRTVGDERVRKNHEALDGKVCSWNDPTVYKNSVNDKVWLKRTSSMFIGHPGEDFRCRCWAEAVFPDTTDEDLTVNLNQEALGGSPRQQTAPERPRRPRTTPSVTATLLQAQKAAAAPVVPEAAEVFTPAKTLKEAEQWAVDNDLADTVKYTALGDVHAANETNRVLFELKRETGERYDAITAFRRKNSRTALSNVTSYKLTGEMVRQELKINGNMMAKVKEQTGLPIDEAIKKRWHDTGYLVGQSYADLVNHEFGHKITAPRVSKLGDEVARKKVMRIRRFPISRYAETDGEESLAEIFSLHRRDPGAVTQEMKTFFNKYSRFPI